MTTEWVRNTIKVHIKAAEACGKVEAALALAELLVAIDGELLNEGYWKFSLDNKKSIP